MKKVTVVFFILSLLASLLCVSSVSVAEEPFSIRTNVQFGDSIETVRAKDDAVKDAPVFISRGYKNLHIVWTCGVFEVCFDEGKLKVRTENGWFFTREQFNALFDFVNVLIEHNWFF